MYLRPANISVCDFFGLFKHYLKLNNICVLVPGWVTAIDRVALLVDTSIAARSLLAGKQYTGSTHKYAHKYAHKYTLHWNQLENFESNELETPVPHIYIL